MRTRFKQWLCMICLMIAGSPAGAIEPQTIDLWPGLPPGDRKDMFPAEKNVAKSTDKPVGDRPIIKLTNVTHPILTLYKPQPSIDTGTAIIVCPGGGHSILAYDHEGTETAEWLAGIGITGIVLKYRVPARDPARRWLGAVQDAQRAVSLVRSKAGEWGIDPKKIGMLGFSAGGETTGLTAIFDQQRQYAVVDKVDEQSSRPDFAMLIYPGGLWDSKARALKDYVQPTKNTPPMFLVHAFNDPVDCRNSTQLAEKLKDVGVSCELHVFATGGHGYGMRQTGHPVNSWPKLAQAWLKHQGYLQKK